ncbi:MAG TPA: hypothetical protein VD814_09300 [Nocardioides sp.]|nr:hypothetical protein [Nocardioides sp.]
MRRESDFTTWVAARWPALVRTLVLLGHPQAEAEQIAREGVARAVPAWEREWREGDVEVLVYREVLAERGRVLRHRGDEPLPPRDEPDLPPALEDRLERRRELEAHLAGLPPTQREKAVLVHVAELAEEQAADVLGDPGPSPAMPFAGTHVREACEAVPVGPVPVTAVLATARRRRRSAWLRGVSALGIVAVVVAATTWWTGRAEDVERGEVSPASNPLPVPWYADGRLHLARVVVEVSGVEHLVSVPDGVVYTDDAGRVVQVDAAGKVSELGETVAGSRLVVEPDNGWVAWADPGDGDPELVVRDTLADAEVGRRSLAGSAGGGGQPVGASGPIAVEDERIYYSSPDGDFAWEPLIDVSFALSGTMVDTAEGARVTRSGDVLRVTPVPYRTGTVIDAEDARLTRDGAYAFAEQADDLVVYDVESGTPIERMYSPSDAPVAWSYHEGTFVFAVLHMLQDKTYQDMLQMPSEGDYRIYACRPGLADPCRKLTEVPEEVADPPVFAQ